MMIFARHPETQKNKDRSFGGRLGDDEVTDQGREELAILVSVLADLRSRVPGCCTFAVFSSDSPRTVEAATLVADSVGVVPRFDTRFNPIDNGALVGITQQGLSERHPEYFERLQLYRRGLLSHYELDRPGESARDHEVRVGRALHSVEAVGASVSIVLSHKSSIGVALISFARRYHGYPADFCGYVEVPTGSISLVVPPRRQISHAGADLGKLAGRSIFSDELKDIFS